jgi:hypothetical protein
MHARSLNGEEIQAGAVDDVDELIKQYQQALDEFVNGNPEPVK